MKKIKEERVGVKLRYCQQASRCTVCGLGIYSCQPKQEEFSVNDTS